MSSKISKNKTSFFAKILYKTLKVTKVKEYLLKKLILEKEKTPSAITATNTNKHLNVKEFNIDGFNVFTFQNQFSSNNHIYFLHGGAYIAEANSGHKKFIEKLALQYNFKITFIAYPLAPMFTATKTVDVVTKAYYKLIENHKDENIFLFGDSAGGGLALTLLQILRDKKCDVMPKKTVLLSPWLDISMTNSSITDLIQDEVLLSVDGLIKCGQLYAGDLNPKDPIVSPIYGDCKLLSDIKIIVSKHEVFYADCLLLKSKLDSAQGTTASISTKEMMVHDWIVLPIKESHETLNEIANYFLLKP